MDRLFKGKRLTYVGGIAIAALMLPGCATQRNSLQAQSRVNPVTAAVYPTATCPSVTGGRADTRDGAINLDCFTFPETVASFEDVTVVPTNTRLDSIPARQHVFKIVDRSKLAYSMAATDARSRNRLTSILLKHSDDVCTTELGRLTANEATTNAALSIINTGLSTASTIVGGELAKSILSGAATLAGASRDHINVHVYRNTIAQAISQVIASERKTVNTAIQSKYTADIAVWSIDDAIREVNVYHGQCSFFKGLELLLKAAENNTDLQAYRNSRAQETTLTRLDQETGRLTSAIALIGDKDAAAKQDLTKRLGVLVLARTKVGLDVADPVADAEKVETPPVEGKKVE